MSYSVGDVILVLFPFTEKKEAKLRPALVLHSFDKYYTIAQITHVDRSDKNEGLWVKKESHWGRTMNILEDSFINLENIIDITEAFINRKTGKFPVMEKVTAILQ